MAPIVVAVLWENQNKGEFYLGTHLENTDVTPSETRFLSSSLLPLTAVQEVAVNTNPEPFVYF